MEVCVFPYQLKIQSFLFVRSKEIKKNNTNMGKSFENQEELLF